MENIDPKISMVIYGPAGVGKTLFAYTFPEPLVFDFDGSWKDYEQFSNDENFKKQVNDKMKVLTYSDGNLLELLRGAMIQLQKGEFKYKTIIIDSLTNLENQAITTLKGLNPNNWGSNLYTNNGRVLEWGDWGNISSSTIALLTELRKYPINFVVITQVDTTNTASGTIFDPNVVGKGKDEIMHFASYAGLLKNVEDENGVSRMLYLTSTGDDKFRAKGRFIGGSIQPIKNPNYQKLLKIIKSQKVNLNFND